MECWISSGGGAFVVMMQPTEVVKLDDTAAAHRLDLARLRAVHLEGLMNPVAMMVVEVASQDSS